MTRKQAEAARVGSDWLPGWSLGQARGVQGSPDWMPGWGLQPGWRHAIRARGPGSGDTKISAVSPEPGCRDARRVCGWTSIVVGVHVFFTHQGNQSSSQCSLALLTHASKHNAVACSQPGHGGPGSLMRARPVGERQPIMPFPFQPSQASECILHPASQALVPVQATNQMNIAS